MTRRRGVSFLSGRVNAATECARRGVLTSDVSCASGGSEHGCFVVVRRERRVPSNQYKLASTNIINVVILRCTQKLLRRLGRPVVPNPEPSSTILGDWYADILFTQPRQVVLCVSEHARLPIVLLARELRTLDERLPVALGSVLKDLHVSQSAILRELAGMTAFEVARTASRSILGTINDYAVAVTWALAEKPDISLHQLSLHLCETPVGPLKYEHPGAVAPRLFGAGKPH
jgi:hypothetical protein